MYSTIIDFIFLCQLLVWSFDDYVEYILFEVQASEVKYEQVWNYTVTKAHFEIVIKQPRSEHKILGIKSVMLY